MSNDKNSPKKGVYRDYGEQFVETLKFYDRKKGECPKGVTLHHPKQANYINLQFVDPITEKRGTKSCGINTFTEESVIEAIQKAWKVSEALKTLVPNEFWSWYDTNILNKSEKIKLLTYRDIFKDIEDEYFSGTHKYTGQQRAKNIASFESSYQRTYGDVFDRFLDWDAIPTWDEMIKVWFSWTQGTKSFKDVKTAITAICERMPNADELLKRVNKIRTKQTIFREDNQSITLEEYITWYESAYQSMLGIKNQRHKSSRAKWLWASAMNVMYGLRPSETAAILNLTKPFTLDGVTVYPLTDVERNPEGIVIVGEYTHYGVTTKTGMRPIHPVPDPQLMERLHIRNIYELTYAPKPGSKPQSICNGFSSQFRQVIKRAKCPVSQLYAFRHLYSYLCELHGMDSQAVSDSMGHGEKVHNDKYRRDQKKFGNALKLMKAASKRPLSYDLAMVKLQGLGVDTDLPDVKLILRAIYQLD